MRDVRASISAAHPLVYNLFLPRSFGGAEQIFQVVDSLLRSFGCDLYVAALIDVESSWAGSWLNGRSVLSSPIQCPLGAYPFAAPSAPTTLSIYQIDLGAADLVISCSHLVSKGVLTAPVHPYFSICMHLRYAWDQMFYLQLLAQARRGLGPWFVGSAVCANGINSVLRGGIAHYQSPFTAPQIRMFWGGGLLDQSPHGCGVLPLERRSKRPLPAYVPFALQEENEFLVGCLQLLGFTLLVVGDAWRGRDWKL